MDCIVHGILQARILKWKPFPSLGDIPNPGIEPRSPALQEDSFPAQLPGKPYMFKTVGTEVKDRELILDNL